MKRIEFRDGRPYWLDGRFKGKLAGHVYRKGLRIAVTIDKCKYMMYANKLAWFDFYGYVPKAIHHKDFDRSNCDIDNMIECDHGNMQRGQKGRGTSKYRGVAYDSDRDSWRTLLVIDGKPVYRERFHTEEEAARAYDRACFKHGVAQFTRLNFPGELDVRI